MFCLTHPESGRLWQVLCCFIGYGLIVSGTIYSLNIQQSSDPISLSDIKSNDISIGSILGKGARLSRDTVPNCNTWQGHGTVEDFFSFKLLENISFCGATNTAVLDFWWGLLWISKPALFMVAEVYLLHIPCYSPLLLWLKTIKTLLNGAEFKHQWKVSSARVIVNWVTRSVILLL